MPDFSGQFGGLMAGAWIAGVTAGWLACVKMIAGPLKDRAEKLETKLDALTGEIQRRYWKE